MIEPFLKVSLIPIKQINEDIIPIFFDMIKTELYQLNENPTMHTSSYYVSDNLFDQLNVPKALITNLDTHLENGFGDYHFIVSFEKMLVKLFY